MSQSVKVYRFPRPKVQAGISKSLTSLLKGINQKFHKALEGKKACVFSESVFSDFRQHVPSGILPLDMALSGGQGWPLGTVEIFGAEACGKSALLEVTLGAAQRVGCVTAMFQVESTLNPQRVAFAGLNPGQLILLPGNTVEGIFEVARTFIRGVREEEVAEGRPTVPIVIGWDSVAATKTRSQLSMKHSLGDGFAEQARRLSEFFQVLADELIQYKALLVLVNQTRTAIGTRHGGRKSSGGTAIPYYCGVRCKLYVAEQLKDSAGNVLGLLIDVQIIKNKFYPPFQHVRFPIYWDRGVDADAAIWHYLIDVDLVTKKGKTGYEFQGRPVTQRSFRKLWEHESEKITKLIKEQNV